MSLKQVSIVLNLPTDNNYLVVKSFEGPWKCIILGGMNNLGYFLFQFQYSFQNTFVILFHD